MSEREERRFVEIPRESVRLMAESTGLELSDEVAALLAEDVCYRLREATQVHSPASQYPQLSLSLPLTAPSQRGHSTRIHQALTPCFEGLQWRWSLPFPEPPLASWASSEQSACRASSRGFLTAAPLGRPSRFRVTSYMGETESERECDIGSCLSPTPCPLTLFLSSQNSSQFMKHTKRRKLTVEDFNRALRWSSVEVSGVQAARAGPSPKAQEFGERGWPWRPGY